MNAHVTPKPEIARATKYESVLLVSITVENYSVSGNKDYLFVRSIERFLREVQLSWCCLEAGTS